MLPTQKGNQFHPQPSTMQIFTGVCSSALHPPVIGRLLFSDRTPSAHSIGACLSVIRQGAIRPPDSDTVGMVCLGTAPDGGAPSLPCLALHDLPDTCHGRIALLDPARGMLFVSPDLKTVNRYCPLLAHRHSRSQKPLLLWDGTQIRLSAIGSVGELIESVDADGFWLSHSRVPIDSDEDGLYELCAELAEGRADLPITVTIPFDRRSAAHDRFRAQIRGLFRGAVFGSFSLLVDGILTEGDLKRAKEQIHRAFCELESEGREFDGYLPKGVRIDTPLLLGEPLSVGGLDFVCVDLGRLVRRMIGQTEPDETIFHAVALRISALMRRFPEPNRNCLILDRASRSPSLFSALAEWRIGELILPAPHFSDLRRDLLEWGKTQKFFQ